MNKKSVKNKNNLLKNILTLLWFLIFGGFLIFYTFFQNNEKNKNYEVKKIKRGNSFDYSIIKINAQVSEKKQISTTGSIVSWNNETKIAKILTVKHGIINPKTNKEVKKIQIVDKDKNDLTNFFTSLYTFTSEKNSDWAIISVKLNIEKPYVFRLNKPIFLNKSTIYGYPSPKEEFLFVKNIKNELFKVKEPIIKVYKLDRNKTQSFNSKNFFKTFSMGPGNSGGPVLNNNNEIIGVLSIANLKKPIKSGNIKIYPSFAIYVFELKKYID